MAAINCALNNNPAYKIPEIRLQMRPAVRPALKCAVNNNPFCGAAAACCAGKCAVNNNSAQKNPPGNCAADNNSCFWGWGSVEQENVQAIPTGTAGPLCRAGRPPQNINVR